MAYCMPLYTDKTNFKCKSTTETDPAKAIISLTTCAAAATCDTTDKGYCDNISIKGCFKDGFNTCFNEK
jgi:hypothetical protein